MSVDDTVLHECDPFHAQIIKEPIRWEDGYIIPPTAPGLGIELDEAALNHPVVDKVLDTPLGFDGSVQDR